MDGVECQAGLGAQPVDEPGLTALVMHAKAWTLVDHHEIFVLQLYPVHL
mgnify:CR=1 FL=1